MRNLAIALLSTMIVSGCSCAEEDPGGDPLDGSTSPDNDGALSVDGATLVDGAITVDGAYLVDGALVVDGGNPLEQPLSEFCTGEGTVVTVSNGGDCAGEIAENIFQFALCACETIDVQSTLELDAFDSRLGPYGSTSTSGTNIRDDGNLGLNGALNMDGKLTVRGAAFIGGGGFSVGAQSLVSSTIYAAGDAIQENSSTTLGRNAYFAGNVEGRFQIAGDLHVPPTATVARSTNISGALFRESIPPLRPCACGADEILDIAAITEFGSTHNDNAVTSSVSVQGGVLRLPCGRYYFPELVQAGGLTIIAEGRTVLFVDGDFTIDGNFQLMLEPGAEVDIFVRGSLSVGASARFGDPNQPSSVRTYVGGTGTITLSASAVFGGNLYAPRSDVVFDASSNLYGSLFAKTARFDGSANIHFDSAVRAAGDSCEEEPPQPDGGSDGGPVTDPDTGPDTGLDASSPADGAMSSNDGGNAMPDPCDDDLDCRAPLVCVGGTCTIQL